MTRDQINQLWTESTSVADFLIAIGVVKVDEPEVPKILYVQGQISKEQRDELLRKWRDGEIQITDTPAFHLDWPGRGY